MFQKVWNDTAEFITSTEKQFVVQCRKSEIYTETIITEHCFSLRMEIWLNIDIFYFASTATNWAKKESTAVNIQNKNYFIETTSHLCAKTRGKECI